MSTATAVLSQQVIARRRVDQIGRAALAVFLLLVAVVNLIVPLLALDFMQRPFLGVFIEYPNNINRSIVAPFFDEAMFGTMLDLVEGDTPLAVDGTPVTSGREVLHLLAEREVGDRVQIEVRTGSGQVRDRFVVLRPFTFELGFGLFGIPYLIGLAYVAIGLWVYRNRRDQVVGRTFVMFCSTVALMFTTTFDLWTTHVFARLWTATFPLAGGMLMSFALVFPSEAQFVTRHPIRRWLPLIPAGLMLVIGQLMISQTGESVILAWRYQYWFASFAILFFLTALLLRSIFAVSPSVREQSRVALAGTFVAFAPFIAFALQFQSLPISWVMATTILFPLVIAYSIVQYSVIDTTRALSFATTYTIMAIGTMIGYAIVVVGTALIFSDVLNLSATASSPLLVSLLTFTLVLVFQPVYRWLQARVDAFFFKTQAKYQDRLTAFRHDLTLASSLGEIVRMLKSQIRESLLPTHVYVFLRDAHTNDFVSVGEGRRPDTDVRFEVDSGLVHALSTTRNVIFLELNKPLPTELVNEHARLAVLRTPVLVPLQGQDKLVGWIAIGNKRSGERYSVQDLRFVQALAEQASLAVERAQVIGDLERRVHELDVLRQISQAVNFTTDPDDLMELIHHQTSKLIDTTNFYIVQHDEQRGTLSYVFYLEGDERRPEREGKALRDGGLVAEVIRTRRPIRTDNYQAECARRGLQAPDTGHLAWMGVPLNAGAHTLGALVVASYVPGVVFTRDQLKVFSSIADQAATALEKARLFQETEKRARQLATLNEISKELSSMLDLESVLIQILRSAVEILNTEAGSLFLIDEETDELVFRVVEGGAQNLVGQRIPPGEGIVGRAAVTGQPVISNEAASDPQWFEEVDKETHFRTKSLLAVPLRIQDKSIGVLEIINKRDGSLFDEEDVVLLTTFAAQAAIAIQNASLFAATDAALQARVDELQNLQRIDRELNRTLNFERVIETTLAWAIRTTGASAGAIGMINAEQNGIDLLASQGYSEEFLTRYAEQPLPLDVGIVGRVLSSGKAEFVQNVANDPDYVPSAQSQTISQITVPILRANRPIGVLVLESDVPDLLTADDFAFVQRLVEHAAVAIENARLIQGIEKANRDKTEFITFIAHELKNPMTSIRGYTDLLKAGSVGPVSDMQVQFLSTIRSNVDRMTRLVSDLSDVARIETGHLRLEMGPIAVRNVVEETLRALQAQIAEKNQELIVEIPDDLPPIFADQIRMVQVLTNLVSNAHKYTPEGGRIWVGAQLDSVEDGQTGERKAVIHHWVRDTGIGMTEEELAQLFTKFYRTQRGKEMAQGTGLGLNITRSLVERHGGTIWVESEVGVGTTFHYTIPVATEEIQQ